MLKFCNTGLNMCFLIIDSAKKRKKNIAAALLGAFIVDSLF